MSRYIDADALKELWQTDHNRKFEADYFIHTIDNTPTADVVEVVRCKDCRWYEDQYRKIFKNCVRGGRIIQMQPTDYCSYGKPKDGDTE